MAAPKLKNLIPAPVKRMGYKRKAKAKRAADWVQIDRMLADLRK